MGFSCFKKPAVQEDFADAPATSNGVGRISPVSVKSVGGRGSREGRESVDSGTRSPRKSPRSSFGTKKRCFPFDVVEPGGELPGQDNGPWYAVDEPVRWTGPPVPTSAPGEEEEAFMVAREAKSTYKGCPLLPWDGEAWSGQLALEIFRAGLKDLAVDPAKGRPDTRKFPPAQAMLHMRRACADILPTPLFQFMIRFFEGPDQDLGVSCDRFLRRILIGCKNMVYCSITNPIPKAYDDIHESGLTGASIYLRMYLLRFAKRFPPQHGFVNPHVDNLSVREKLADDTEEGLHTWECMEATEHHPAAIVVRMTNKGLKAMNSCPKPMSWLAINHLYEFCISEPSRELSGQVPIFIIDLGKLSFSSYTKSNVLHAVAQCQVALFHSEPFSAFVVAHVPTACMVLWSFAKYFITDTAREKFIILSGSASKHFTNNVGVSLDKLPVALGGTSQTDRLLSLREVLRKRSQQRAIDAQVKMEGFGSKGHRPDGEGLLKRVGDSAGEDMIEEGGRGDKLGRSNTMGAVMTLQGRVADLESKLQQHAAKGGQSGGHVMRTMMIAQAGIMLLLIFIIMVLLVVLINGGNAVRELFNL